MHALVSFLTNFGDLALLLPLAIIILVWLLAVHCARGALAWLGAAGFCAGTTGLLKVYFFACPLTRDLVSPSGHTSLSTLVYGAIGVILVSRIPGERARIATIVAGTAVIMMIAVSRVLLNAHTALEVGVGFLIGAIALGLFAGIYWRHRPMHGSVRPLALAGIVFVMLMHGQELHAEGLLHAISAYLQIKTVGCG